MTIDKGLRTLVVLRSISGGGKSTYQRKKFPNATVCSADHFFIDRKSNYNFNPKLLGKAHGACKFNCRAAMRRGDSVIVIDNTNTTKREMAPYLEMAKEFNYVTKVIRIDCPPEIGFKRNTHGVPLEAIQRMAKRMVPLPGEEVVPYNFQ